MPRVTNMRTLDIIGYSGITAREAVIAAHAQSKGDWNTWRYAEKYGNLVEVGSHHYFCGDFAAVKDTMLS